MFSVMKKESVFTSLWESFFSHNEGWGSFSGWQRSMGRFNGNWDEVCEVLGKISQVTGSDLEEGIDLSCCPYGWIHSQGCNAQWRQLGTSIPKELQGSGDLLFVALTNYESKPPWFSLALTWMLAHFIPSSWFGDSCGWQWTWRYHPL